MVEKIAPLCCVVHPEAYCQNCKLPTCELHKVQIGYSNIVRCKECTLARAVWFIKKAIRQNGQYSHNICSNSLRWIRRTLGTDQANKLVDKFKLTQRYGINKIAQ